MAGKIIHIKQFDIENERNINTLNFFIELTPYYFRWFGEYDSEIPKDTNDHKLGWDEKHTCHDLQIKRTSLCSVEKIWDDKNNYWRVELEANGFPNTITLYFKEMDKEVDTVHTALIQYIFFEQW